MKDYKKTKRKLQDKKWVEKRYLRMLEQSKDLEHFLKFECSSFFKGYELAEYNAKKYNNRYKKLSRKIEFIKQFIVD